MARTAYLAVKVSYVVAAAKNNRKASVSNGNKTMQAVHHGRQANKADRMTRQPGLLALFCAC